MATAKKNLTAAQQRQANYATMIRKARSAPPKGGTRARFLTKSNVTKLPEFDKKASSALILASCDIAPKAGADVYDFTLLSWVEAGASPTDKQLADLEKGRVTPHASGLTRSPHQSANSWELSNALTASGIDFVLDDDDCVESDELETGSLWLILVSLNEETKDDGTKMKWIQFETLTRAGTISS